MNEHNYDAKFSVVYDPELSPREIRKLQIRHLEMWLELLRHEEESVEL